MLVHKGAKPSLFVIFFASLFLLQPAPASAQTAIGVRVGVNRLRDVPEYFWWKLFEPVGCNIVACVEVPQTNWLTFSGGIGFLWFPLRAGLHAGYNLTDRLPPTNGGHGFHQLRYSIGFHINTPSRHAAVVPYLAFGGALISEYVGSISVKWPDFTGYVLDPSQRTYWVYNIGIGLDVNLHGNFILSPSARYESNDTDRIFLLYTIDVGYRFEI
jgi:hypothetical protein